MAGVIRIHACVWMTIPFPPFLGKEEPGDEEECDNGNVALRTIKTCSLLLSSTNASWCRLSSEIEFSIRPCSIFSTPLFSLSILYATSPTKKKFSYHTSLEERNPSIMYGFRSDILSRFFFCHLIYACLCGSIALILQYKDKAAQRDGMKRLFEVISKAMSIHLQAVGLKPDFFPLSWIPFLFLDAGLNEDVEMASQNPGTVSSQNSSTTIGVITHDCQRVQIATTLHITYWEGRRTWNWLLSWKEVEIVEPMRSFLLWFSL